MIFLIGAVFGEVIARNSFYNRLVEKIFLKKDKSSFKFKNILTILPCKSRMKMIQNRGKDRIDRELDVIKYIRMQILTKNILTSILGKAGRREFKNSGKFIIPTELEWKSSGDSDLSSSEVDGHEIKSLEVVSKTNK